MVCSAATSSYEVGNPADERAQQVALNRNLSSIKEHRARRLHQSIFHPEATEIILICMDQANRSDTLEFLQKHHELMEKSRVLLFSDFGPEAGSEVIDPYYGDLEDFRAVLIQCERYSIELLSRISNKN